MTDDIIILVVDDDQEDLDEIEMRFKAADVINFMLVDNVPEFLKNLHRDVRIAIIDHYFGGEGMGPELMQKVKDNDIALEKLIPTKIIIISGQKRRELQAFFRREGCDYIDKNDRDYLDLLVDFVKINKQEIEFRLTMLHRQLGRIEEVKNDIQQATERLNKPLKNE